jgi:hypothetical protein
VLRAAVDAVADRTMRPMGRPDLKLGSDQVQRRLQPVLVYIESEMWNGITYAVVLS